MSVTIDEVQRLARLSRLEFTEAESKQFQKEFEAILEQVDAINKVDVSGVDLYEKTIDSSTDLRLDDALPSLPVGTILQNAPEQEDGAFVVPQTVLEG